MIYLPNKLERYTSTLRNYLQNRALKEGITPKILENMRKIYIAEALLFDSYEQPINISLLSSQILSAVYIKKTEKNIPFEFKVKLNGNFITNKKLYTALLLNICKDSQKVSLFLLNGKIAIKATNANKKIIIPLTKKLKGIAFFEKKSKDFIIILKLTATGKKAEKNIYLDLQDPFSPINFFIF